MTFDFRKKRAEKRNNCKSIEKNRQSRQRYKDHFYHIELMIGYTHKCVLIIIISPFYANTFPFNSIQYSIIWIHVKSVNACIIKTKIFCLRWLNQYKRYKFSIKSSIVVVVVCFLQYIYEIKLATGICLLSHSIPYLHLFLCPKPEWQ